MFPVTTRHYISACFQWLSDITLLHVSSDYQTLHFCVFPVTTRYYTSACFQWLPDITLLCVANAYSKPYTTVCFQWPPNLTLLCVSSALPNITLPYVSMITRHYTAVCFHDYQTLHCCMFPWLPDITLLYTSGACQTLHSCIFLVRRKIKHNSGKFSDQKLRYYMFRVRSK